jgi:hypothetical protein
MSLTTSTFACNSNLSLESCTYNLITNTRTSNNSRYPQCWLNTQVITQKKVHHKLHQQLPKFVWKNLVWLKLPCSNCCN